jgi:hypothetical protein
VVGGEGGGERRAVSSALTRDSTFKLLFHIIPKRNETEMTFFFFFPALQYCHFEIKKKRQIQVFLFLSSPFYFNGGRIYIK